MNRFVFVAGLVLLVFLASFSLAEIPRLINYQGMLTESDGTSPVPDGQYNMRFKIYGSLSEDDSLWWEQHTNVDVTNGLFNVILGGTSSLYLPFDTDYWLGITVGTDPELSPRIRLTSVGYAYRALVADSAEVAGSGGDGENSGWLDIGTVVRLQNYQDSVGIGTALPAEKLHVVGDIRLSSMGDIAFGDDNTRIYESANNLYFTADNDIYVEPDDDIYIRADGGSNWIRIDPAGKKLGIGTESPTHSLTVNGTIAVKQADSTRFHLAYYNQGLNFSETGVADYRLYIKEGGDVGIGTSNPGAKLGVNGDLKVTGAYKGNISSSSGSDGAPFPRPAYDSGWLSISQNENIALGHNIGGDPDYYVVDMQFWDTAYGINTQRYGGDCDSDDGDFEHFGAYYWRLTSDSISVRRMSEDYYVDKIRVRIWVYK
jgi:hypothetical protein